MEYIKKNHLALITLVILLGYIFVFGGTQTIREIVRETDSGGVFGSTATSTITNPWEFEKNIDIQSDVQITGKLRGPVLIHPEVTATTTTGTAATLIANDLTTIGYHVVTFGGAVDTDFTYTLPASSTLTALVPTIGSRSMDVCFYLNASSTSDHKLIFAAGTGIDIRQSTTTDDGLSTAFLQLDETDEGCFEFRMKPQNPDSTQVGDITAIWKALEDSD